MMTENERPSDDHDNFKQLAAWAALNTLSASERDEFEGHSKSCDACCDIYRQYLILAREGMPLLAAHYGSWEEQRSSNDTMMRGRLFDRIRGEQQHVPPEQSQQLEFAIPTNFLRGMLSGTLPLARTALAVCLIGAVGLVAYRIGSRTHAGSKQSQNSTENRSRNLLTEKQKAVTKLEGLLEAQTQNVLRLEQEQSIKDQELTTLRASVRGLEEQSKQAVAEKGEPYDELRSVTQQRDMLNDQLRDAEQSYANVQAELASLRSERDDVLTRSASLESKIEEFSTAARDREKRLADDEQYLAYDRDIRELMGARQLYIADVFDVDSRSRKRNPFGRVFYTQGKSLLFYAFDLDGQADLKNASAFQVWGRKVTDQAKPLNLGILYMDSESNRRWVLRFDDPKQLTEIDAVFVTVEPHGGSRRPTGKPFLYALLRKEANHP